MRILVTGGAGYIGCHAARELLRRGYKVVIYDNLSTGHRFLADGFAFVEGDIGDRKTLAGTLDGMDAIMHFAAHAYVGESVCNPRKYFENNVQSGLCLLNAAMDAGIRNFVFSSTCAVYGIPAKLPIPENQVRQPMNPYGVSKLFFEHALQWYGSAYGLRYAILRYFNAAGADESGGLGELHDPETHLIPLALMAAAGLRKDLDIYGSDYPTADGTCVRDYVHVTDLADAHVLALEYLLKGGASDAFNLGTGKGYSVLDVVSAVEQITGQTLQKNVRPRRPGDPPVLIADSRQALELLHWRPSRSIHDIVATAWTWMQSGSKPDASATKLR
jgi:UDP-glucose 4-epimerase